MKQAGKTPRADRPAVAWPRVSWVAALLLLAVAYRIGAASSEGLWNTAPLMAMCFGGGLLLGWRFCWAPAVLLFVSDAFLGISHGTGIGAYTYSSAVIYTVVACLGAWIAGRGGAGRWWVMLLGTWSASVLFYLVGNTWAWMASPEYTKTLAGWWQSQTTGLPGPWPPAIYFLRNALIGDTLWCLLAAPLFFWQTIREPRSTAMAGLG